MAVSRVHRACRGTGATMADCLEVENAPRDLDSLGKGASRLPPRMAEELRSLA
jgi:hypothetical protein